MSVTEWISVEKELPPEQIPVETKIDDENGERNNCILMRYKNFWMYPENMMYVYYTPTHWRLCNDVDLSETVKVFRTSISAAIEAIAKFANHCKQALDAGEYDEQILNYISQEGENNGRKRKN